MSRSYKKYPAVLTKQAEYKKFANRKFRRQENEAVNEKGQYKKHFQSTLIVDYKETMTREQAIERYNAALEDPADPYNEYILTRYPTLKSWLRYWYTTYKRK